MTATDWRDLAISFAIAGAGALLFGLISFPSAPLTGSAVAISIAGLVGLRTELPTWMRDTAFVLLGINIGTAVTPEMAASAARWPLSILVLLGCLVTSMSITRWVLVRFLDFESKSATLASAPGHLSHVLSMSLEMGADTARISIVQSIRVLSITLFVPLFIANWFGPTGVNLLPPSIMSLQSLALSFIVTILVGRAFVTIKLPAAYLLAGMLVSAGLHVSDVTPGRMPDALTVLAFLTMGMLIGSRFSGQRWADIRSAALAGLCVTGINMVVALAGAILITLSIGLPVSLLLVAFAPGGVEAMAAIAVMMGIDPAFVAAHHVFRLLMLTFLVPLLMKVWR